jgi:hypothetical protein
MKKFSFLFATLLCLQFVAFSQNPVYGVFESKTLFQIGMMQDSAGNNVSSIVRFTPFANYSIQAHKDFSNTVGAYIGIGVKNQGFITKYNNDTTVKSRAYCLSIPVGLKFGNMEKDMYFYLAGEFLAQFDYKEKVFYGSTKDKRKNLYTNDINPIVWSSTVGVNLQGFTIGAEYTLTNFFQNNYQFQTVNGGGGSPGSPGMKPSPSASNILTFFIGFRTKLNSETVSADEKKLQQAMAARY